MSHSSRIPLKQEKRRAQTCPQLLERNAEMDSFYFQSSINYVHNVPNCQPNATTVTYVGLYVLDTCTLWFVSSHPMQCNKLI